MKPTHNKLKSTFALIALSFMASSPLLAQDSSQIDFGSNAGDWVNDGQCDDPRFEGPGVAAELAEADRMRDAEDCANLFAKNQISLRSPQMGKGFSFGDNTSEWANDGECDDPRFEGAGAALLLMDEDNGHDAADCKRLIDAGQISLSPGGGATRVSFGDNASEWANDAECDDPRFEGPGMTQTALLDEDMGHDANDCSTAYFAETINIVGL